MNNKAIKYTTKTENNNASQKRVFVFLSLCKQNRVRKRTMPKLTTEQRVFIVTHYIIIPITRTPDNSNSR